MRFYERVLSAKLQMMTTVGQSPEAANFPPEMQQRVMHAFLVGDGWSLMAGDAMGQPYSGIHGIGLALDYGSVDEARRVFEALADGGKIGMPLVETFWSQLFGRVTDRFGVPWLVNGPAKPLG